MMEEELRQEAEGYFETSCPYSYADTEDDLKHDVTEAYMAGAKPREKRIAELKKEIERLKAGKPRWHKVADEGLPSDSSGQTYVVIDAYNCCALASFDNGTWHNYRNIENVVAWCEIPKYKEE